MAELKRVLATEGENIPSLDTFKNEGPDEEPLSGYLGTVVYKLNRYLRPKYILS